MTTPDTSAVRAWAKDNGYDVADRGRLPGEVTDAYVAAHKGGATKARPAAARTTAANTTAARTAAAKPAAKKAPAKKAPAKKAPAKKAPAKKAPAKKAPAEDSAPVRTAPAPEPAAAQAPGPAAAEAPARLEETVKDDHLRLMVLGPELAALTKRVEALEAALGRNGGKPAKTTRFRRRS